MKTKKLLLPMFGLGLALAVAQPAAAGTESLNLSNAAAIALYELRRERA